VIVGRKLIVVMPSHRPCEVWRRALFECLLPCCHGVQPVSRREAIQRYASAFQETTESCGSRPRGQTWSTKKVELKRTFQENGRIDVGEATSRHRKDQAQEAANKKEVVQRRHSSGCSCAFIARGRREPELRLIVNEQEWAWPRFCFQRRGRSALPDITLVA
jgi:hypothetical protein